MCDGASRRLAEHLHNVRRGFAALIPEILLSMLE